MAALNFSWRGSARRPHIQTPRRESRPRGRDASQSMSAFTTLAVGALAGMMMTYVQPTFVVPHATAAAFGEPRTTAKTSRLPRASLMTPADTARKPEACKPLEITPARPGPIAYV